MGPIRTIEELIDLLKRRWLLIVAVTVLGTLAALIYAVSKQHLYHSSEVIQVQTPMVSESIAPTIDAGSSARRLQLIEQQIMSRTSLLSIIDELGLYTDLRALSDAEKAQLLRQSVTINGVAAAREGFSDDGTVSLLRISATMPKPEDAQAVAHEVARRTIALSVDSRLERARETAEFLRTQENAVRVQIAGIEGEIALFRDENDLASLDGAAASRREIEGINEDILALEREMVPLQQTLDRVASLETVSRVDQRVADEARKSLQRLTSERDLLSDRVETLTASVQASPDIQRALAAMERDLANKQAELLELQRRLKDADLAFQIEAQAQSERLTVIEPATLPDYPITGSRKTIALAGLIAALLAGIALAYVMDLIRPVIRNPRQMEREIGLRPIVTIPELDRKSDATGRG